MSLVSAPEPFYKTATYTGSDSGIPECVWGQSPWPPRLSFWTTLQPEFCEGNDLGKDLICSPAHGWSPYKEQAGADLPLPWISGNLVTCSHTQVTWPAEAEGY